LSFSLSVESLKDKQKSALSVLALKVQSRPMALDGQNNLEVGSVPRLGLLSRVPPWVWIGGAFLLLILLSGHHLIGLRMIELQNSMRIVLSAALLALCGAAFADDLIGQASVIDGDTIEIHGTRIRIFGIDAPESDQLCRNEESELYRCGQKASNSLFEFIARRPLECVEVDRDRYNRAVAVCSVGGTDIADWLVRNGLALDWPRYSKGGYAEAQVEAKREGRGMWSGSFKEPWNYRACRRSGGRPEGCSDD
jgi:endonuclease YncB( thermonuclease family)